MKTIILLLALTTQTESEHVERLAPTIWSEHRTGVKLPDNTIVDVLTPTHAIEADWCTHKVYEAIGQALHYAEETGKKPGVLLLIRDPSAEWPYLKRAAVLCGKHGIKLWVRRVEP